MIRAKANRDSRRFTPVLGKLVLEFDGQIINDETGLTDRIVKQIVLSETLDVNYEQLEIDAIAAMGIWESENSTGDE